MYGPDMPAIEFDGWMPYDGVTNLHYPIQDSFH